MTKFPPEKRPRIAADMWKLFKDGKYPIIACPRCGQARERDHTLGSIAKLYCVSVSLVSTMVDEHATALQDTKDFTTRIKMSQIIRRLEDE